MCRFSMHQPSSSTPTIHSVKNEQQPGRTDAAPPPPVAGAVVEPDLGGYPAAEALQEGPPLPASGSLPDTDRHRALC